ncbi:T9SS type A sorting domain-containing protein [Aquimarina sp. 2201CG1-2-11]|uniref:fibronectin type III domain-containing protein n=1 Tax=Aquimarina discodermiae TaxID=3231043 RepID=UPI003462C54A
MKKNAYPILAGISLLSICMFSIIQLTRDNEIADTNIVNDKISELRNQHSEYLKNSPYKETKYLSKQERKELRLPPDKYYEQMWELTINPATGRTEPEVVEKLRKQLERKIRSKRAPGDDVNNPWISRGSNNVGGRTRAVLFDPNDPNYKRVFSGGVSGGLWVNDDITLEDSEWRMVQGVPGNLNVTTIAVDPKDSDIWYLGTGEQYTNGDVVGNGIYKSVDGGVNWKPLNILPADDGDLGISLSGIFYINDIVVWENIALNRTEIFVGVGSGLHTLFNPFQVLGTQSSGIYRSIDNGETWNRLESDNLKFVDRFGNSTFYIPNDFEIGADNKLWMSTVGVKILGDIEGGRIFSSIDGENWLEAPVSPLPNADRLELEVSSYNANKLYALSAGRGSKSEQIYVTTDGFNSEENLSKTNLPVDVDRIISRFGFTRFQGFYNLMIESDPTNDSILYVGGIDLFRSVDNGASWDQISKWTDSEFFGLDKLEVPLVHADQHAMVFRPGNTDQAIFGNDGGVNFANSLSKTQNNPDAIQSRVKGYITTQFVKGAIGPNGVANRSEIFSAGAQDNGTQAFINPKSGANGTVQVSGGDGGYTFVDKDGEYLITTTIYNRQILKVYLPWNGSFDDIKDETLLEESSGDFVNAMGYDDKANFLLANSSVRSSNNKIKTIDVANNKNDDITNSLLTDSPTAFVASPYTDHTWLVGLKDGKMIKLTDVGIGTATWVEISNPFLGSISSIRYGATDNDILVTIHNYGVVSVWASVDGGETWMNKEGDLPNIPVRDILQNPLDRREVILATQLGVWKTRNFDTTNPNWVRSQNGMSDVRVTSFDYWAKGGSHYDNVILASTYGRGVFTGSFTSNPDDQAPTAPTNLTASNITSTTIDVSWTASSDNVAVTRYDVLVDGKTVVYGITETNTTLTRLNANTEYSISVIAYDAVSNASEQSEVLKVSTLEDVSKDFITSNNVVLYPNPVSRGRDITVTLSESMQNTPYSIANITGAIVKKGILTDNSSQIGIQELDSGVYFLQIRNNKENYFRRFVKE